MATTIKLKNGSGAPLAGDLVQGEPALDLTNKRLYTEDSGGTVIEVGTNPTSLTTGTFTSTGIDDNATSTAITIDASQNVGIGTNTPQANLEIKDGVSTVRLQSSSNAGYGQIAASSGTLYYSADPGNTQASSAHVFSIDGDQKAVIDASGNVGIGQTSPDSFSAQARDLVIGNTSTAAGGLSIITTSAGNGNICFGDATSTSDSSRRGKITYDHADNSMSFDTLSFERMRINSSGNVGIGTTSPEAKLDVNGSIIANSQYRLRDSGGNDRNVLEMSGDNPVFKTGTATGSRSLLFETEGLERMRLNSSGNLLVGTTGSPSASSVGVQIGTSGGTRAEIQLSSSLTTTSTLLRFYNPNGQVGSVVSTGNSTVYNTSSDVRLKENIVDAPAGNIDAIRVRSFDWKANGTHQTYGMVAQELVDVAPEAVSQGETEDDIWAVDYSKLVPMMIKEIQDLRARVAQLEEA